MTRWSSFARLFVVPEESPGAAAEDAPMDPGEIERVLASTRGASPPEPEPEPVLAGPVGPVEEGRAFDAIYAEAAVPAATYRVEKLLKVLEGLANVDTSTRRTLLTAMDAADESWTLADPLNDALNKVEALKGEVARIAASVSAAEADAAARAEAQNVHIADATAKIQAQIAELQTMLLDETRTVAQHKAEIEASLLATKQAALRETARVQAEIARLNHVVVALGDTAAARS